MNVDESTYKIINSNLLKKKNSHLVDVVGDLGPKVVDNCVQALKSKHLKKGNERANPMMGFP